MIDPSLSPNALHSATPDPLTSSDGLIFVCYSRVNLDFALDIANSLNLRDFRTWIDVLSISSRDDWLNEIKRGIAACSAVLYCRSSIAEKRHWVQFELNLATLWAKPIIAVDVNCGAKELHRGVAHFRSPGRARKSMAKTDLNLIPSSSI